MKYNTEARPAGQLKQFDKIIHNKRVYLVLISGDTTKDYRSFQIRDTFINTTEQVKFALDEEIEVVV